ncbi:MAG: winged helix-turn-helix transcriptional regulator [Ignavibacteriae bacterium]|nr:winged helix-turn-helix transcriptional regulator [Ignavibacteriota bacterium]MCB9215081.1 winged helix-turn-helix transcriptional regulator [Ignavibacteria bacterium]
MSTNSSQFCNCLHYTATAFARKMNSLAEEAFATTGLAPSYAFLLMAANRRPGISPSELSGELMLTPSTITRLVEKLEAKGFVQRKTQGRQTEVHPTEKSLTLDPELRSSWKKLYQEYTTLLGEKEAVSLTHSLNRAVQVLEG